MARKYVAQYYIEFEAGSDFFADAIARLVQDEIRRFVDSDILTDTVRKVDLDAESIQQCEEAE